VVGVAVLGQIVAGVCAASFPVQAKRKISIASDLKYLGLEVITDVFAPTRQNCRGAGHKNKKNSSKDRTTHLSIRLFVGAIVKSRVARAGGVVATNPKDRVFV
jgi:hypothetical protein